MKTHVTISADGEAVNDSKALQWAKDRIGLDVTIGTCVMLNAFRLLRVQGDIEELVITFCDGETFTTNEFGRFADWPKDPVIDVTIEHTCAILTGGLHRD